MAYTFDLRLSTYVHAVYMYDKIPLGYNYSWVQTLANFTIY
jgi:hypothetical protein